MGESDDRNLSGCFIIEHWKNHKMIDISDNGLTHLNDEEFDQFMTEFLTLIETKDIQALRFGDNFVSSPITPETKPASLARMNTFLENLPGSIKTIYIDGRGEAGLFVKTHAEHREFVILESYHDQESKYGDRRQTLFPQTPNNTNEGTTPSQSLSL